MLRLRGSLLQSLLGLAREGGCYTSLQEMQQLSERRSSGQECSSSTIARPPREPWTPTRLLDKRKAYPKRMRYLISTLENEHVTRINEQRQVPDFRSGDILEVQVVVPEADRKVYTYKGVCLARGNKGLRSWFKMYNVFPDVGGFIQHFPLYMPDLVGLKVVGRIPRARRAKLYHLLENESGTHTYQVDVMQPK